VQTVVLGIGRRAAGHGASIGTVSGPARGSFRSFLGLLVFRQRSLRACDRPAGTNRIMEAKHVVRSSSELFFFSGR
jgi:hypothetical protein